MSNKYLICESTFFRIRVPVVNHAKCLQILMTRMYIVPMINVILLSM